jgi:hypothetical protein
MAVTQYIGSRYVPLFADPAEWSSTKTYEALTIVLHQGNSYTSKQFVPVGIDIDNTDFWAETGNYNAQVEFYRQETARVANALDDVEQEIADVNQAVIDNKFTLNNPEDTTSANQEVFINNSSLAANNSTTFISGGNNTKLLPSIGNFGFSSSYDFCAAVTLMNTYLRRRELFTYANNYTATTYEGTYSNPVLCDPREHKTDGLMHIDCATFTTLISDGVNYTNSAYNGKNNIGYHKMFDPTSPLIKPYWKYNRQRDAPSDTNPESVGYGRVLTDALAKLLYDAGKLNYAEPGFVENIMPGAVLFSGDGDNRFMRITHCSFVGGFVGGLVNDKIIVEAHGGLEHGLGTRMLTDLPSTYNNLRAYYMPEYISGMYLASYYSQYGYTFLYKNKNLYTEHLTWSPIAGNYGARVITIVPTNSSVHTVHVEATSPDGQLSRDVQIAGLGLIILPYGWSPIDISCTEETATFNVCTQIVYSDCEIFVPVRGI